jgi:hypothetical protein
MKKQKKEKNRKKKQKETWLGRPNRLPGGCGTWSAPTRVVYSTSRNGAREPVAGPQIDLLPWAMIWAFVSYLGLSYVARSRGGSSWTRPTALCLHERIVVGAYHARYGRPSWKLAFSSIMFFSVLFFFL